jgi:hypothetical protein
MKFSISVVTAAHKELSGKRVKHNEVKDDLFSPPSGVKWFDLEDPDGNQVLVVQAYVCEHFFAIH